MTLWVINVTWADGTRRVLRSHHATREDAERFAAWLSGARGSWTVELQS